MSTEADSTTAQYWDDYARRHMSEIGENVNRAEWLAHPIVQAFHRRIRGGLSLEQWVITNYLAGRRIERAVGVGAGVSSFELNLLALDAAEHFDLYDLSAETQERGKRAAADMGVVERATFIRRNIATADTAADSYDLVTGVNSLHHLVDLDGVFSWIGRVLRPTGLLFAIEYVGPNRFAFPPAETLLARQLYRTVHPLLRQPWPELSLPDPAAVAAVDPTEAVHSEEIIPSLKRMFEHVEVTPMGGPVIYPMWGGLHHDRLFETDQGMDLVASLLEIDAAMVGSGKLAPYFALIVASNSPLGPR